MILTKSVPSVKVNCVNIPVKSISVDVAIRLISSQTSFSYICSSGAGCSKPR